MKINIFRDGPDRIQIVIDGENLGEKIEDIAKAINASILEDSTAKPLNFKGKEQVFFPNTPYEGMDPSDVLERLKDKGITFLKEYSKNADKWGKKEIENSILQYMKSRFQNTDPIEFAEKLNAHQITIFFNNFGKYILSDENMKEICSQGGYDTFDSFLCNASNDEIKDVIIQCIEKIQ